MSSVVRRLATAAVAVVVVLCQSSAHAQYGRYYYPRGYGGYGWNGWGGGTGTVQGDVARGLGAFAAGAGVYNEATANANAINTDTAIRFNQYMFQSQMEANKRYQQKLADRKKAVNETSATVYDRLRNHPEAADITSGDALNVVYDELSDPRVYAKVFNAAKTTVKGTLIREIPFQSAADAITASVDDLTKKGAPPALRKPAFEAERTEMRAIVQELRGQNHENGQYDKATLEKAQNQVLAILRKVDEVYPKNSRDWNESRKFLKAAYGLLRLLETPAIDVLLAGVEKRPEATLSELLTFMQSFNLRFGVAKTPQQKNAYNTLYPLLTALRDQALSGASPPPPLAPSDPEQASAFFEGIDVQDLTKKPRLKQPDDVK
ncbi:MAG: hypothetical protein P4L84_00555 [Isosphaeraceae bacterium]|nr:hypothetical protein [Isosphaeraceae bacterium]